jgi:hypothetical protein
LNRLVNDGSFRRKLSLNARRTIEQSYSLQVWGPRLASLFDQLCTERPADDGYHAIAASSLIVSQRRDP